MNKIKWCVIGAGGIADRRTIPGILKDEGSTLVAVMDKSPEIAKRVGDKYGVPAFTDEEAMLSSVECDAVYVGTPVFCHKDQALTVLRYGKHLFIEKPITISATEARKLVDAFKAAGKQISVGYMMKHHNLNEKVKEIVAEGGIGKPVSVRAQFSCWYPDIEGAWRQTWALGGGGAFMDLGVHCAELIEYVLDDEICELKSICSTVSFNYEVEDSAIVVFKTRRGTLGHIDVNFNIPDAASESKLEVYGEAGYAIAVGTMSQVEGGKLTYLYTPGGSYSPMQDRASGIPTEYLGEGGDLYQKQIGKFCDILRSGKNDYTFADKAVHIQELVEMIYSDAKIR